MSRRVIGHMVIRNELGRYLAQSLPRFIKQCDTVVVYDDRSHDGSLAYVRSLGVAATERAVWEPSFAENEGEFRSCAWDFMTEVAQPNEADWIICLDADEFLVGQNLDLHHLVARVPTDLVTFNVAEVFDFDHDGVPLIRTDGYWGAITAHRLCRWRDLDHHFEPSPIGGGSLPSRWMVNSCLVDDPQILHYGYATRNDRTEKHHRYDDVAGHNPTHIQSILTRPCLQRWEGEIV